MAKGPREGKVEECGQNTKNNVLVAAGAQLVCDLHDSAGTRLMKFVADRTSVLHVHVMFPQA